MPEYSSKRFYAFERDSLPLGACGSTVTAMYRVS